MNPLKQIRKNLSLSQEALASRLGVTRRTVCAWETTPAAPRMAMLALETVSRSISSAAKQRADESGKI